MAADCQMVAQELSTRLFSLNAYLRLNVSNGLEDLSIDDWNGLGDIGGHTRDYMRSRAVYEALESSLRRIRGRVGTVTVGQISEPLRLWMESESITED